MGGAPACEAVRLVDVRVELDAVEEGERLGVPAAHLGALARDHRVGGEGLGRTVAEDGRLDGGTVGGRVGVGDRVGVGVGDRVRVGVRVGVGVGLASTETQLWSVSSSTRLVVSPPFLLVKVTGSSARTITASTSTLDSSGAASTECVELSGVLPG